MGISNWGTPWMIAVTCTGQPATRRYCPRRRGPRPALAPTTPTPNFNSLRSVKCWAACARMGWPVTARQVARRLDVSRCGASLPPSPLSPPAAVSAGA
jgi:hypothetical protein